jgi:hypothetical protein
LTILGIMGNVAYTNEVDDPVYEAKNQIQMDLGDSASPLWISNHSLAGLGCTEQYQICNSQNNCTDPGGIYQISNSNGSITRLLNLNDNQSAMVSIIWRALFEASISLFATALASDMFLSRDRVALPYLFANAIDPNVSTTAPAYYLSTPVNSNQWQVEVQNLQNQALALIQRLIVEHASQPNYILRDGVSSTNYLIRPSSAAEKALCAQQKVRGVSYSSFNVFGLAITLGIGGLIIGLSYAIAPLVARLQNRSGTIEGLHRRDEWERNDVLQILRSAYEAQNPGTWTNGAIPTTVEPGKKMRAAFMKLSSKSLSHKDYLLVDDDVETTGEANDETAYRDADKATSKVAEKAADTSS